MGHGDHWECIGPFSTDDIERIMGIVQRDGDHLLGCEHTLPYIEDGNGNVVEGAFTSRPLGFWYDFGTFKAIIVYVQALDGQSASLWTAYPYASRGKRYPLKILGINPWENQIEAEIIAETLDGNSLAFFDVLYFANASRCEIGAVHDVALSAMAFGVQEAESQRVVVDNPETIGAMRAGTEKEGDESLIEVRTDGVAAMLPIVDWDICEYEFQAPVKSVLRVAHENLEHFLMDVTLMRGDGDYDVPLFVSRHVVTDQVPAVGDDIDGRLWLHGHIAD